MAKKLNSKIDQSTYNNPFTEFCKEAGLSKSELARMLGYKSHTSFYRALERGFRDDEIERIDTLFRKFGVALLSYRVPEDMRYWNKH